VRRGGRHRGTGRLLGEYARPSRVSFGCAFLGWGLRGAEGRGFHPHKPLGEAAAGAANIKHVFDSREATGTLSTCTEDA
jgi:hypothetical protein